MTIYIDNDYKCHVSNPNGAYRAIEMPDILVGKCPAYIEGYCCDDSKGYISVYPWRDKSLLDEFQAQYEAQQQTINEYEAALTEIETALGVTSE